MQQIPFKPWAVNEDWGFEIKGGEFENVVVQIKKLDLVENSDGNCELEFHIIKKPDEFDVEKFKTQEFNDTVTSIIQEVIKMAVENAKASLSPSEDEDEIVVQGNISNENRDSNPPEPNPQ